MIRKFSITNALPLLSPDEVQCLREIAAAARLPLQTGSEVTNSSHQDSNDLQYLSTQSTTDTAESRQLLAGDDDYEELYIPQSESDHHHQSIDEGLSMSEEDDDHLPPDHKEFLTNRRLEDMSLDEQLMVASRQGQGSMVRDLLMQGTQVTIDQNGTTAIHQAAQGGFADVVRILLDHGTDIDVPDSSGYAALHKAAGKGHLDVLALLINEGCDIDTQDDTYGNTPLHEAAWNGYSKSVDILLKNKSNCFIANRAGCTALHLAAQSGHNQSGRALLYAGCSPDVKNNYGDTPLHTAARYGHAGIARILISARCSISEQNKNGDTSLHIAAAFKRRKIAKLLVEGGINIKLTNKQGETATEIARRKDHLSIIEIIHHGAAEPTGGVRLDRSTDRSRTQSSQRTASRETTPDTQNRSSDSRKKSTGLVSWIRRKFVKEKMEKEGLSKSRSSAPKSMGLDDGSLGLFSQYVKRQGFAYYRDLAGNIRQGPVGYVPNCHCEAIKGTQVLDPQLNSKQAAYYEHMASTNQLLTERLRDLELQASRRPHGVDIATQERLLAERQECLDRLRRHGTGEKRTQPAEQTENHSKGENLQSWLATQISEGRDSDPFGYTMGTKQQRFGDDFDHERIARYEAMNSESFPPPPRLFRSRSDETLTHSEYSFHGRAFKSREAAMEELKILKHHEEIRERRKLIRAGVNVQPSNSHINHYNSRAINQPVLEVEHTENHSPAEAANQRSPGLWMSRDHLDDDNSRTDTGCESHDTTDHDPPIPARVYRSANTRRANSFVQTGDINAYKPPPLQEQISNSTAKPPPQGRVLGRRERSISPDRKPEPKTSVSMPLKSAMRQPRVEKPVNGKPSNIYRSNSLPRDSKVEFNMTNGGTKKPVKTVRYDETVKAAEIKQDLPPSVSPAQAEETLLPAKREAPIGGHDEKYSESSRPHIPSYQSITSSMNSQKLSVNPSHDLRDSIVNARKELRARNKSDSTRPSDNWVKNGIIPKFDPPNSSNPNYINRNGNQPLKTPNISTSSEPQSMYYSQDMVKKPSSPQTAIPFSQYKNTNNHYGRQVNPPDPLNRLSQPYSTSSLPRPQKQNISGNQSNGVGSTRRAPLPSYEQVQSNRLKVAPQPTTAYNNRPPSYQLSKHPNPNNIQAPPLTRNTINGNLQPTPDRKSFYEASPTTVPESTLVNNTGSCSSSNPDSGYGGHFYDERNKTGKTSPADYNSFYKQNIQSTALKMTTQQAFKDNRPAAGRYAQQPPSSSFYSRNGFPMSGPVSNGAPQNGPMLSVPKRTVYSNMISDV